MKTETASRVYEILEKKSKKLGKKARKKARKTARVVYRHKLVLSNALFRSH